MRFERYAMVDWSAAATQTRGRDSIWVAHRAGATISLANPPTRHAARAHIHAICRDALAAGERLLVGFDFPFGYPAGVARHLTGRDEALPLWRWIAARLTDDAANANNRFQVAAAMNRAWAGLGPAWGRPASVSEPDIPVRARDRHGHDHPTERRLCEGRARGAKTVWQLAFAGSVGSQVLTGLPSLLSLRDDPDIGAAIRIWPFETGLAPGSTPITFAEIYPSLLTPDPREPVRDAGQVRAVADWLLACDRQNRLAGLFAGPDDLSPTDRAAVAREEGWILGLEALSRPPRAPKGVPACAG